VLPEYANQLKQGSQIGYRINGPLDNKGDNFDWQAIFPG